jgi:hypothetical protein
MASLFGFTPFGGFFGPSTLAPTHKYALRSLRNNRFGQSSYEVWGGIAR